MTSDSVLILVADIAAFTRLSVVFFLLFCNLVCVAGFFFPSFSLYVRKANIYNVLQKYPLSSKKSKKRKKKTHSKSMHEVIL